MPNFLRHLPGLAALAVSVAALAISLGAIDPKPAGKDAAVGSGLFDEAQVAEIGKLSRDYLLGNPEIIRDAIQALQAKEEAQKADFQSQAVTQHKDALFGDASDPVAGNLNGDVTLIEFFDYKCPYCKQVSPALEALLKEDPNLKIVFKEFPILGDASVLASRAALAAAKQEKYLPFHQALMAHRGALDLGSIAAIAASVGLDPQKLAEDMKSETIEKQLAATHELALSLSIRSTPTFIVGDKVMPGALSIEELKGLIEDVRKGS
ncbi:DsbA family protein [Dongia sp.]|uniref:DsbA family protein n=1 Tax=Dongia sp. TaxID=1977262 RepID=UPI0035AE0FE5